MRIGGDDDGSRCFISKGLFSVTEKRFHVYREAAAAGRGGTAVAPDLISCLTRTEIERPGFLHVAGLEAGVEIVAENGLCQQFLNERVEDASKTVPVVEFIMVELK